MHIKVKRAYEKPSRADGTRVLVDRLWPRGISKSAAAIHHWLKELAPSTELCQWFRERPPMWRQFRRRYLEELRSPQPAEALQQLYDVVNDGRQLTLVFGSRDPEHNNAVVLKELLEGMPKPPSSTGPEGAAAVPKRARAKRMTR